jgi:hypothetical protein
VVESLLAATLIFVYAALRALPTNAKLFTILLDRLRIALDRPNTSTMEVWERENNPDMLIWVLVVASSVAPLEGRACWIGRLSEVCEDMQITTQLDLEKKLNRVAWTDVYFGGELAGIWAEILRLRRHLAGHYSMVPDEASTSTIDLSLRTTQTWDKELDWGDDGRGYEAPIEFDEGRWKVNNWYI